MNDKIRDMLKSSDQEMVYLGISILLNQGEEFCSTISIVIRMNGIDDYVIFTLDESYYLIHDKPMFYFIKELKGYMKINRWQKVYL